ncbi:cysteine desulfurase NifS [bacterium]|nr:cysteine desulfurase NifS [bacterium]MBU1065806.1 cysteine desulfurase NifS [bacterium]MBU1633888.1 cysteine desulfurase NifS [bacterium]MBU1872481.1 cysteine desulfurase NifS [bacterium]
MKTIYLDHAATTATDLQVIDAMLPYFHENYGNPSSIYSISRITRNAIENARTIVANSIGADPKEIVFTSGGSESDNFAIKGIAQALKDKGNHIITSQIEHHAVLYTCKYLEKNGYDVTYLPVDNDGIVKIGELEKAIRPNTILITIMHANNEIGTIQPIRQIGEIARKHGVKFHTDAVQTFGHIQVNVDELNVDFLSVSGHKFYGPKGIGALYIRKGSKLTPLIHGGDQERRRRASTENVPGIVGFGKAVELALDIMENEAKRQTTLRNEFIKKILVTIPDTILNGHPADRLPNNINISFEGIEGESILLNLDMYGIAASTGSACSSSSLEPSHVLLSIGLTHEFAHGSVRFSLGKHTSQDELNQVAEILPDIIKKLRAMSPLYNK